MATAAHLSTRRPPRRALVRAAAGALGAALVVGLSACTPPVAAPGQAHLTSTEAATSGAADASATTPATAEDEALLTAAPDEHSEVGELVPGFPTDLLPLPDDAVVLVTSAVPVGDADVQEVSLNLRTMRTAEDVLALYRAALTAAGFTEVPAVDAQTDLAVEARFTRSGGDELLAIGVIDAGGARTVTIGGRLRTDG